VIFLLSSHHLALDIPQWLDIINTSVHQDLHRHKFFVSHPVSLVAWEVVV
jgi:hypothetical protein